MKRYYENILSQIKIQKINKKIFKGKGFDCIIIPLEIWKYIFYFFYYNDEKNEKQLSFPLLRINKYFYNNRDIFYNEIEEINISPDIVIPKEIFLKANKLEILKLNNMDMTDIYNEFDKLTLLTELDLNKNQYIEPKHLQKLNNIEIFNLNISEDDYLNSINDGKYLKNWTNLRILDETPTGFNPNAMKYLIKLTNIESLYISQFTPIDYIKNFSKLKHLKLNYNNNFNNDDILHFTLLEDLNLYSNRLIGDKSIKCLTNLKHLNLGLNYKIKNSLNSLTNLKSLKLNSNNQIYDEDIKSLTNLKKLYLGDNDNITNNSVENFTKLKSLYLNYNITDDCLSKLTNIYFLCLPMKKNEYITNKSIQYLTNLKFLNLNGNYKISNKGITNLINLITLGLGMNNRVNYDGIKKLYLLKNLGLTIYSRFSENDINELEKKNIKILK